MGKFIVKIDSYYLEWSTITDSPTTFGMKLQDFKEYYRTRYGTEGILNLDTRLTRTDVNGTSLIESTSVKNAVFCNRAGPDETELTLNELRLAYCLQQPIRNGWTVPPC